MPSLNERMNTEIESAKRAIANSGTRKADNLITYAVQNDNYELAAFLLQTSPVVDTKDSEGNSAIHIAAAKANMRMLALLAKHGANLDALNANGDTPLLISIKQRHDDAARFLVDKGANVNLSDRHGTSTLVHAAIVDKKAKHKSPSLCEIIIHSKDYVYNEEDMRHIQKFNIGTFSPRLQSNLQKVAAVAGKPQQSQPTTSSPAPEIEDRKTPKP